MIDMISELFIPKKRIVIEDDNIKQQYIDLYNGKKNLYESVYCYTDVPDSKNAIIDKIFLDFDYDDDLLFYDDVRKVAKYLYELGVKFCIRFSGRGFHIFILCKEVELKHPNLAIKKWVNQLHRRTETQSDRSVVGDTRRVCRILDTKNLKTGLYCIPLKYNHLCTLSYEDICDMAKERSHLSDYYYGYDSIDLTPFDNEEKTSVKQFAPQNIVVSVEFPPCINGLLSNPDLGYHERRELIIYLRDDGYTEEEIYSILKEHLSHKKFAHCTEEENQLSYLMRREDILFSNCEAQKMNGVCNSDTCDGCRLYL